MNIIKLNNYPGENFTNCCAAILVNDKCLEISGYFKPDLIGYITLIFENSSDSRFYLWEIQMYKEVKEFIKKLYVCDMDVISAE